MHSGEGVKRASGLCNFEVADPYRGDDLELNFVRIVLHTSGKQSSPIFPVRALLVYPGPSRYAEVSRNFGQIILDLYSKNRRDAANLTVFDKIHISLYDALLSYVVSPDPILTTSLAPAPRPLRPATFVELLAFGATHRDIQRRFPIGAIGQRQGDDKRNVPFLDGWLGRRELGLHWSGAGWLDNYRFAAVRKK